MGSIITLDNLNTEEELAPTQDNFPALQHFWQCKEVAGSTTLTDSVGGVIAPLDSFVQTSGEEGFAVDISQAAATTAIAGGTLVAAGAKNILVFFVGDLGTSGTTLTLGNLSTAGLSGYQFNGTSLLHKTYSGTITAQTVTAAFGAAAELHALVQIPSVSLTGYDLVSSGATWAPNGTPDTTTIPTSMSIMNQSTGFGWSTIGIINSMYGCAIMYFDTLPLDLEAGCKWMYNEWVVNHNKVIYPGWKGRS